MVGGRPATKTTPSSCRTSESCRPVPCPAYSSSRRPVRLRRRPCAPRHTGREHGITLARSISAEAPLLGTRSLPLRVVTVRPRDGLAGGRPQLQEALRQRARVLPQPRHLLERAPRLQHPARAPGLPQHHGGRRVVRARAREALPRRAASTSAEEGASGPRRRSARLSWIARARSQGSPTQPPSPSPSRGVAWRGVCHTVDDGRAL